MAERLTVAGVAAAAALVAAVALLTAGDGREQFVHRGQPAFTLLYTSGIVRPLEPQAGELARIGSPRRRDDYVSVSRIPDSELPFGALPLYGERYIEQLREQMPEMRLLEEGKALIWGAPGYRVEFRDGDLHGHDILMFPDDLEIAGGVLLSYRRHGGLGKEGSARFEVLDELRKVQRSFQFGTDRR